MKDENGLGSGGLITKDTKMKIVGENGSEFTEEQFRELAASQFAVGKVRPVDHLVIDEDEGWFEARDKDDRMIYGGGLRLLKAIREMNKRQKAEG